MRIHISTASHGKICIRYCKSRAVCECAIKMKVRMIKGFIILPSYTGKYITRLLPSALLLVLCHCNNTDSNKLNDIFWYSFVLWWYLYSLRKDCPWAKHSARLPKREVGALSSLSTFTVHLTCLNLVKCNTKSYFIYV